MRIDFETKFYDFTQMNINPSFAKGKLRVAYSGLNRNNTFISKEAFENSISSAFNCPIVAHYIEEQQDFGGHDIKIEANDNDIEVVNLTIPVGVVPESSNYEWEVVQEEDGTIHEYLSLDVLIWKRQKKEYEKILNNEFTKHSMEIEVKDGSFTSDGYYKINDFCFTAFCLLGQDVEPCFESSQLSLIFDKNKFKEDYTTMMNEIKEMFCLEQAKRKGESSMDITETFESATEENVDKTTDDIVNEVQTDDNTQETFEEVEKSEDVEDSTTDENNVGESEVSEETNDEQKSENDIAFNLDNLMREITNILCSITFKDFDWDIPKYEFVDIQDNEIIVFDNEERAYFGLKFETDNDDVIIDFENKVKKVVFYRDFVDGDKEFVLSNNYSSVIENMQKEIDCLSKSVKEFELKEIKSKLDCLFSKFENELGSNEEFVKLKSSIDFEDVDLSSIESQCYAILGKANFVLKTTEKKETKQPITIPVSMDDKDDNEVYGGLFKKYGYE